MSVTGAVVDKGAKQGPSSKGRASRRTCRGDVPLQQGGTAAPTRPEGEEAWHDNLFFRSVPGTGSPSDGSRGAGPAPGGGPKTGPPPWLDDVVSTSAGPDARQAEDHLTTAEMDALLLQLRELRERIDRPVAQIAARFVRQRAWRALGHARQEDYSRHRLKRTARWLRETAALGKALRRFPALDEAFTGTDGERRLGKTAAVQIAAVASDATLPLWIERARSVSFRQLLRDVQRAREDDALRDGPVPGGKKSNRSNSAPWAGGEEAAAQRAERPAESESGDATDNGDGAGPGEGDNPTIDVVLPCPPEVVAAFEETLDLHRAVCGREASIVSFIEALLAEAEAGPAPPDPPTPEMEQKGWDDGTLRHPGERRRRPPYPAWMDETDPATRARRCRDEAHPAAPVIRDVAGLAADVFRLEQTAQAVAREIATAPEDEPENLGPDAQQMEDHMRAAGRLDAAIERAMARLLAALRRERPWGRSGVVSADAPDRDEAPTWATGLTQYAEERVGLSGSRARQLARVADRLRAFPMLQRDWTQGRLATDQLLELLPLLGGGPIAAEREAAWSAHAQQITIRRLRDEVRELRGRSALPRRGDEEPPPPLDDDGWYQSLRRRPGRTIGRVQRLAERLEKNPGLPRNTLRLVVPLDLGLQLLAALDTPRPRWHGLMLLLLDYAQTWDPPAGTGHKPPEHASIYERDGYRCTAPDCTGRANLQAHHIRFRSQDGSDAPENLTTLCMFHHQQGVHDKGTLTLHGRAPLDLLHTLGKGRHARTLKADRVVGEARSSQ